VVDGREVSFDGNLIRSENSLQAVELDGFSGLIL